ncbi:hypothetical protein HMPREF1624_08577 [Sporothrix schenckii ATCC 58251]|uniref:Zn(2)-C6 fungal-type domain-containing protein n=1 Tax=Sporothrix schenckii (strain ATCC 58251 / de Perez 2211183) TaxID=1391915 RepID=U7PHM8_SPOS1|nr:hypothetical protein HMPREF1624_08577 [Sporothrix schenckii ATCC 58251]
MPDPQNGPSPDAAEQKKRRACDECRTRKLACTKEADGCRRCRREGIACIYSAQKPMGRPRKRPRTDEEEKTAADAAVPADSGTVNVAHNAPDGDVGLSILADQVSSPGFTFFDFLGIGDNNALDPNLIQQQHTTHEGPVPTSVHTQPVTSFPAATSAVSGPSPPSTARHSPMPTTTRRYEGIFPRSLFGINFSDIDFNTGPTDVMASGVPTPPTRTDSNGNGNSNGESPSGGSDVPTLASNGSQSSQATETPASNQPPRPMVTPGLTPGLAGTSPHGWVVRQASLGILPPSPKAIPQQLPPLPTTAEAAPSAYDGENNGQKNNGELPPFEPKAYPLPEGTPTLVGGIPTVPPVDAYSKSSAAWLLTAPNRVCGCLARLYLALDSLQHLPTEVGPAMTVARNAAHTAHDTVLCPSCSPPHLDLYVKPPVQAFQNLMILSALLPTIAHAYRRIVAMVDEEAQRAAAAKERLPLSLTEYGGVWGHMARWDNVCAQTSSMDNCVVDPPLWRLVVRALLKMDVYGVHLDRDDMVEKEAADSAAVAQQAMMATGVGGPSPASDTDKADTSLRPERKTTGGAKASFFMVPVHFGLKDIAEMMEERSKMRHKFLDDAYDAGLIKTHDEGGECGYHRLPPGEKPNCQKVIEMARQEIDKLVIV